jgi:hypothetical protein
MFGYKDAIETSDKPRVKKNWKIGTYPAPPQHYSLKTLCINVFKQRKIIKLPLTVAWDRTFPHNTLWARPKEK